MIQDEAYGGDWSSTLLRTSDRDLQVWLEFAQRCADAADEIALASFRQELAVSAKADGSYVTEADLRIEEMLRDRIAGRFPDHRVTGEEFGADRVDDAVRWYLDPIDGTHNFMRGIPLFGTLIAVECDQELQLGILSAPALGQRWFAARGLGAWAVGGVTGSSPRRISVSAIDSIHRAQILFRSVNDMHASRVSIGYDLLLRDVWRGRGFGDCWGYALVADGAAEAMMEQNLGPWDLAAPWVLIEEAGGRITDFEGRRSLEAGESLATNGVLHGEIVERLHRDVTEDP